jgi:hypothetical protein
MSVFQRWRFLVAFAINSSGSVFFAYLLGIYPEKFSSITANSLTLVVTFLTERMLKKNSISKSEILGLSLIVGGIFLIL